MRQSCTMDGVIDVVIIIDDPEGRHMDRCFYVVKVNNDLKANAP